MENKKETSNLQLCRKCNQKPQASENCPYCHSCWNSLSYSVPEERYALVYYGNKMMAAQNPKYAEFIKQQRKLWQKNYRIKNREKWNEYQRNYARKKRQEAKKLREELDALKKLLPNHPNSAGEQNEKN